MEVKKVLKYCACMFDCHGGAYPSVCKQNWNDPRNPAWESERVERNQRVANLFPKSESIRRT